MDTGDLESAINSAKEAPKESGVSGQVSDKSGIPQMSEGEELGFHKGALNTLMAERNELMKMVGNVEAIAGAHVKRLKELGVDAK